jgi:hypothetical protein
MALVEKDKLLNRWNSLKQERSSWDSHWEEIGEYLLPRSGRFNSTQRNDGRRKHNSIYDSTGTRALRVLSAGMMAGMTSPARPWFRLTTADSELAKSPMVKRWMNDVTRDMLTIFQRSNTYRSLHSMYEELGAFGTGAALVLPDYEDVIRHYSLTIGEYAIATDYRGQVITLYREFEQTVGQMVAEFGKEACSNTLRNLFDRGDLDKTVTVIHAIEPRMDRDISKRDSLNMPWRSIYFEQGGDKDRFLRESGFREFPALAPRWASSGGDIYGNSPGMEALGDIKQLQHEQLRKAQGIDYQTKPPLQVPTGLKNREIDSLPGGVTYVDAASPGGGIRTAFDVPLRLDYLLSDIQDVRGRINGAFFSDVFLMMANGADVRMTATEVAERHDEKMLILGPVLERLHNEMLDPMIEMTFTRMAEAGILPPIPQELQGMDINVEFVSVLAQAQRAVGTNSVDRYVANLGAVAQFKPDVLDKFDADHWADAYADMLGVDPELVVPGEQVAFIRQQRAQQAQAQQIAAAAQQAAATAKDTAAAGGGGSEGLTNVMSMFSGYNS